MTQKTQTRKKIHQSWNTLEYAVRLVGEQAFAKQSKLKLVTVQRYVNGYVRPASDRVVTVALNIIAQRSYR